MMQEIEPEKTSVPWTGLDVLLFLAVWFAAQIMCDTLGHIAGHVSAPPSSPEQAATTEKKDPGHQVVQMIQQSNKSLLVLLVAFFAVVVIAPLIEEFLFRLLLQGWLEAKLTQFRVPYANGAAIVAVSFFFASLHGGDRNVPHVHVLFYVYAAIVVTSLLVVLFGFAYLERIRNVPLTHCLFGQGQFFHPQFFSTAKYCLLAVLCIQGIAIALSWYDPNANNAPIPIFIFSLILGTLYSRTRNLSYCILLHACLNLMSFTFVCLLG